MSGGPIHGRAGILTVGSVPVGKWRNITVRINVDIIREHSAEQGPPEILAPGDESYPFTIAKLWVDSQHVNQILSQTATGIDVIWDPAGSTPGNMRITLGGCILSSKDITGEKDGAVIGNISGEGKTYTPSIIPTP